MLLKKIILLVLCICLLNVFDADISLAAAKKSALKISTAKIKKVIKKRAKHKSALFGSMGSRFKNPLLTAGSNTTTAVCPEYSPISYNELSVLSCSQNSSYLTALARANEVCASRGCRRAINVTTIEDKSTSVLRNDGRRYEYLCRVSGYCTSRLF